MNHLYSFSEVLRIWQRVDGVSLPYSDGDDAENYLLDVLKNTADVSSASPELSAAIRDWPSEYHLSRGRHNLLRFLDINPSHRVLELGCGCGAITRYLGESGASVIAVEGSLKRAQIAAQRCRDLPNVSIYCDNVVEFKLSHGFDYITLIGVLEYARQYVAGDDPILAILAHANSLLKEGGVLVVAIENQLGLKYFSGCNEDHTGVPFFGINGLYGKTGPVTFGRRVLADKLKQAGFPSQAFFYPFPDYKLPGLILSESALLDNRLNVADLLIYNSGCDYPETYHRTFAEDLAWRAVIDNHLLADLANSFLVCACSEETTLVPPVWLAKLYSRGNRLACYQIESSIEQETDVGLTVRKRRIFSDAQSPNGWLSHAAHSSPYLSGDLLAGKIRKMMACEAGLEELAVCFAPWLRLLLSHSSSGSTAGTTLPGEFVDCIPANIIISPSGEVHYFDSEWVSNAPIPLAWIVVRGVAYAMINCLDNRRVRQMTYRQFISAIAEMNDIFFSDVDFVIADEYEDRMITQCHLDAICKPRLADFLDSPLFLVQRLSGLPELRRALVWHEEELARIKKTVSWRITAPLRVAWNQYQKLLARKK